MARVIGVGQGIGRVADIGRRQQAPGIVVGVVHILLRIAIMIE